MLALRGLLTLGRSALVLLAVAIQFAVAGAAEPAAHNGQGVPTQAPTAKKWTDSSGMFSIEAEFVGLSGGQVTLKRTDNGRTLQIPLDKLCDADQQAAKRFASPASSAAAPAVRPEPSAANKIAPSTAGDESGVQTVRAEGVGSNSDDALKDAFRNAVRQVVGAVVDADTLVKNDELIDDKVLTYSNGFVKSYEKLSEKTQGGLLRVKIEAKVERRNVVAKLKSAHVAVKNNVDGQSMFAEVATQLEEEKDAAKLLEKALKGFPDNCIKTEVIGKPEIIDKSDTLVTVQVKVGFSADPDACKAFGQTLEPILDKVARAKDDFSVAFSPAKTKEGSLDYYWSRSQRMYFSREWWPKALVDLHGDHVLKPGTVILALNRNASASKDRLQFRYYVLDAGVQHLLVDIARRQAHCKVSLLDATGDTVAVDQFRPGRKAEVEYGEALWPVTLLTPFRQQGSALRFPIEAFNFNNPADSPGAFLLSVVFIQAGDAFNMISQRPSLVFKRKLKVGVDELKRLTSTKSELTFTEN